MITNTQKIIPSDRMIRSLSDFQGLPVGCLLKCYWIDIGEVKHVMFKYRDNYVVGHNHGQGGKMKLKFQSWWNIDKSGILTKTGYNTQTEFRLYANTSYLINSDKNPKIPVADNIIDVLERSKIKRCIVQ